MKATSCLLVVLLLSFNSFLCAEDKDLFFESEFSKFILDKAKGLDPEVWSSKEEADEKSFKKLLAGKKGNVIIPIWWKDSLRPKKTQNGIAEIIFKDVSSSPIKVNLFAGLPGEIEIHRIGGLGDMKWKTAFVPIPWDQIMRMKKKSGLTYISFIAPKEIDIPFHSIKIKRGNKEIDEKRWCLETRAWVARAQLQKRANAILPKAEISNLSEKENKQIALTFPRSMVNLIYPNSAPQKNESEKSLKIQLALNELEGGQFGVYANQKALKDVQLKCSVLKTAKGLLFDGSVDLFTLEYSAVTGKDGKHPLYPQKLWPAYSLDIGANASQAYWINVESFKYKTKPGLYTGKIEILSAGKIVQTLKLEVKVLPFDLMTMTEAELHLGGCVPRFLPAHELKELSRHNHNSINLWYSGTMNQRPIRKSSTEFELDLWLWDDFMQHANDAKMKNFVFFLGGNPYGYPDTMQMERDLYRFIYSDKKNIDDSRAEWLKSTWKADGKVAPEIRELYSKWIYKFYSHAKKNNWPEPIVTPFDEPAKWTQESWARGKQYRWLKSNGKYSFRVVQNRKNAEFMDKSKKEKFTPEYLCDGGAGPWIKTHFKDCSSIIHKAYPSARIYGSIHHAKGGLPFLEDVDVFCTNAIHQDHDLGNKVRAVKGKTFWQYSGTNDKRPPSVAWYTFGFYFGAFNSRGSLVWAYNWGSRFDTASSGGQWMYGWTSPYSLIKTPYLEGLREGWDDRRYIETLRKVAKAKGKEKEAEVLLSSIFSEVIGSRNKSGRDTVNNFFAQSKDPNKLTKYRQLIVDKILEFNK
ncbi:MAG: hypothetical protein COA79_18165 [Planctomycetota bacterium]|nr:MAG: hypothetical protein COA79_18165 [Planctomycetota bacterium]